MSIDDKNIIIIDGMNLFIRHFAVNLTTTAEGQLIGGVVGFLKFIEWSVSTLSPGKIFVVWEMGGGCKRRKAILPEYKENRAKLKDVSAAHKNQSRNIVGDPESKNRQLLMLVELLKRLPICQVFHDECECDDIVAYLAKSKFYGTPNKKIIISSDKDFYQLLSDKEEVSIYDPGKKIFIDSKYVIDNFGIPPHNFCLTRTIWGDRSDNIKGVKGVGEETIKKYFQEELNSSKEYFVSDFVELAKQKNIANPKIKCFQTIVDDEQIMKRNWQLMYLGSTTLSAQITAKINHSIDNWKPKFNQLELMKFLLSNDITTTFDINEFSQKIKICLLDYSR